MAAFPTRKWQTDKVFLLSVSLLSLVALATTSDSRQLFEDFVVKFGKKYQSKEEYWRRYHIFKESVLRHQQLNHGRTDDSALYGVNQFSDLTPAEFREKHLSLIKTGGPFHTSNVTDKNSVHSPDDPRYFKAPSDVPPIWDWRSNKTITAIRDQGSCGGCWAFSIVETIESQWSIEGHPLEEYSVQQVLDCDRTRGSHGCRGGDTCNALAWMNQTTANLVPKKDYPYTGKDGECKFFSNTTDSVHLTNYTCRGYENHEDEMVRLLHDHGTLAIIVDATSWQDYLGGIIQHHCSHDYNNHAVQIVGYNIKGGYHTVVLVTGYNIKGGYHTVVLVTGYNIKGGYHTVVLVTGYNIKGGYHTVVLVTGYNIKGGYHTVVLVTGYNIKGGYHTVVLVTGYNIKGGYHTVVLVTGYNIKGGYHTVVLVTGYNIKGGYHTVVLVTGYNIKGGYHTVVLVTGYNIKGGYHTVVLVTGYNIKGGYHTVVLVTGYNIKGGYHTVVLVTGYNIKGDVPYFIVRNSWGSGWGLDGYLHIRIGSNLCGVANQVSTVSV
ncbi:CTSO [Branchiostoma lanceolatum]|uniref:CTSO protein n=1 Tax=Branchiostoma lanceolatum TaxID=7740 RepID=A0A8K0EUD7_BRALA|nr:CTSO [Branchiostoma lanceolatum]